MTDSSDAWSCPVEDRKVAKHGAYGEAIGRAFRLQKSPSIGKRATGSVVRGNAGFLREGRNLEDPAYSCRIGFNGKCSI